MDKKIVKKQGFSMSPHPSTNLEIQRYYQNEPKFNGVCYRDILTNKIKNKTYVINLGEYADIGIHWITLYANNNAITYFDSFRVEYIRKKSQILHRRAFEEIYDLSK